MTEVDAELLERVARWCAEAGRQAGRAEIRRALGPLGWDELLAVRALLADPPPARPLGPHALADIARGAPPDLAAERERGGRYPSPDGPAEATAGAAPRGPPGASEAKRSAARGRRAPRGPGVVIRRARDLPPARPAAPPPKPPLDELLRPEGRAVLERLVRVHGARRAAIAQALAGSWRRPDGGVPGDEDVERLLDHHGLVRAFERRERNDLLHALRAAGGVRARAAVRVGLGVEGLDAALARLGALDEAERIREARRADLRGRATLSERVRLVLADEERLRDLGLLAEFEDDLRARLPEHLRALRRTASPIAPALARSLSLTPWEARALGTRFGLAVEAPRSPPPRSPTPRPRTVPPAPRGKRRGPPRSRR
jgi:hypothetical protein